MNRFLFFLGTALVVFGIMLGTALTMRAGLWPFKEEAVPSPDAAVLHVVSPLGLKDADSAESEAVLERRARTHAFALRGEWHISAVLADPQSQTRKTKWFTQGSTDVPVRSRWLRDHLQASVVPGTMLIEVRLEGIDDPAERNRILEEVVDKYLLGVKQQAVNSLLDRTAMLNQLRIKTEMSIRTLTDQMKEKQVKLNLDGGGTGKIGLKETELQSLAGQLMSRRMEAAAARRLADVIEQGAKENKPAAAVTQAVEEAIARDPRLLDLRRRLDDVELQLAVASKKTGEAGAAAADLNAQADVLKKKIEEGRADITARTRTAALEMARHRAEAASEAVKQLDEQLNGVKQDLGELSNALAQYRTMEEETRGLREQLKQVKQQIDEVMAVNSQNTASDIRWLAKPALAAK